jgi:outer membrane beta-barrel protein
VHVAQTAYRRLAAAATAFALSTSVASVDALAYDKASDSQEVVLNKLFPKKGRVELDAKIGMVLNSSYTQTYLANSGLTYFWSEEWGFNVEGNFALVNDKNERTCIETFYNDPNFQVNNECGGSKGDLDQDKDGDANFGPAYVPIRQLKYIVDANFVWNPIYGKQIILLSATNYFDFYIAMGGGMAFSDFYPKQVNLKGTDTRSRGRFCVKKDAKPTKPDGCDPSDNPGTTDESLTGKNGRPDPQSESNVAVHLAIGQRFHFLKRFLVTGSLENYTLVGTEAGFDNFLTIMGGFGIRF